MEQRASFGDYRFDLETGRLWSRAEEVRLTPKASAVLKLLVENAGKPVTKGDLFASVWKDTAVTDDALTTCIQELRKALADDAKQPRFIETRHRRGYRFAAQISWGAAEVVPVAEPSTDMLAIAVLPFADMSPEHNQDYLCEGLAEELINVLAQIEGLRVVSRTAAFQFRSSGGDIQEIGRLLGVGTLLEGSVRKAGEHLRVTVQLIEVASGYHRWSQRFDRRLDDVFAIQDEIAESVAASLRGSVLSQSEKQALLRPHTRPEAYEYYLRGSQYLPLRTESGLKKGAEMFTHAIGLDAHYSPAFAGLAMVHAALYEWYGGKDEDQEAAERASLRALELAPGLAEAHVARGFALSLSRARRCYDECAEEFEEALRLAPNLFDAYYYYARASFAAGHPEKAVELFRKAMEVRLEDCQSPALLALPLRVLGRHEEAQEAAREAIRRAERILMLNPRDVRTLSIIACSHLDVGEPERGLEWSRRALECDPNDMSALVNSACVHARLGHKEEALALLERVLARGWGKRDWIERDPDYEILRDDPRFQKLVAGLK
jgi:adenylate cyclase